MPFVIGAIVLFSWLFGLRVQDVPKELQPLQGRWLVTSINGADVDPADMAVFRILGDQYMQGVKGKLVERGRIKVDASKTPMAIDFVIAAGRHNGLTQLGIVEVTDGVIKFHLNLPAMKDRPADFTPRDGFQIVVGKRAK
jgi:uncharacterized protein (TIGR03067 family)